MFSDQMKGEDKDKIMSITENNIYIISSDNAYECYNVSTMLYLSHI